MRHLLVALATGALLAGCQHHQGRRSDAGDRNRITAEQIAAADAVTAWDCVEKLRPHWLRSRGPRSLTDPEAAIADVFVDGQHRGKVEVLHGILVSDVHELRFLPPGPAAVRFGMGYPRGVIAVERRTR